MTFYIFPSYNELFSFMAHLLIRSENLLQEDMSSIIVQQW